MSETKTIQTVYGEASIDVVECSSCGNEIAKETAARFAMDTETPNPRFNNAERSGYACEHCFSEGPLSYPEVVRERLKMFSREGDMIFGVVLWPLTSLFIIAERNNKWDQGYAVGTIGGWFWLLVSLGLCLGFTHF